MNCTKFKFTSIISCNYMKLIIITAFEVIIGIIHFCQTRTVFFQTDHFYIVMLYHNRI